MGGNAAGVFSGGSTVVADFGVGDGRAKFQWGKKRGMTLYVSLCLNAPKDTYISSFAHITLVQVVSSKALPGMVGFIYTVSTPITIKSQKHRIIEVGKDHEVQYLTNHNLVKLTKAVSVTPVSCAPLGSMTSLGSLFQCLTILSMKNSS